MISKLKPTVLLLTLGLTMSASSAAAMAQYKIHDDCLGDWAYCESFWLGGHDIFGEDAFVTLPLDGYAEDYFSPGMREEARRRHCRKGQKLLSRRGFDRLQPVDCTGRIFTYWGSRDGAFFEIQLNPGSGRIIRIERI
jgi:hypothetical protein